ncbi:5041_t:CDS:1, partial [Cetraspora pellucida]
MNQSGAQIINAQLQPNNGQLQRPQNIGGPQNGNGQFQGSLNIGRQTLRPQNLFNHTSISVQYYTDLVEGTNPFTRTQGPPSQ